MRETHRLASNRRTPKGWSGDMADETTLGPISYLIVQFPGNKMTGEGFPILVDLVDRGVIRILDLMFVTRDADGSMAAMELRDFDADGELDLAVFEGASSGLLDEQRPRRRGDGHRPRLVGGDPDLREPLGDAVHPGAAWRRSAARRRRIHPAGRDRWRRSTPPRADPTTRRKERPCPDFSEVSPARPSSPERRPQCPTACRAARRIAGRSRRTSSTRSSSSTRRRRQYAPAPAAAPAPDTDRQLKELAELKDQGILTDDEFAAAEGQAPRVAADRSRAVPPPTAPDVDAVRPAAEADAAGRVLPVSCSTTAPHVASAPGHAGARGGAATTRSRALKDLARPPRVGGPHRRGVRGREGARCSTPRPPTDVTSNAARAAILDRALRAGVERDHDALADLYTDDVQAWTPRCRRRRSTSCSPSSTNATPRSPTSSSRSCRSTWAATSPASNGRVTMTHTGPLEVAGGRDRRPDRPAGRVARRDRRRVPRRPDLFALRQYWDELSVFDQLGLVQPDGAG